MSRVWLWKIFHRENYAQTDDNSFAFAPVAIIVQIAEKHNHYHSSVSLLGATVGFVALIGDVI